MPRLVLNFNQTSFFYFYRESPAIYISKYLLDEGAKLNIFDPKVSKEQIMFELSNAQSSLPYEKIKENVHVYDENILEACKQSHAIVVCTEWDMFKVIQFLKLNFILSNLNRIN